MLRLPAVATLEGNRLYDSLLLFRYGRRHLDRLTLTFRFRRRLHLRLERLQFWNRHHLGYTGQPHNLINSAVGLKRDIIETPTK